MAIPVGRRQAQPMKVNELIQRLAALDPDLPVMMPAELDELWAEVRGVFVDVARPVGNKLELAAEWDQGRILVARLFDRE